MRFAATRFHFRSGRIPAALRGDRMKRLLARRHCLIVGPEPLVAEDIAEAVRLRGAEAHATVLPRAEEVDPGALATDPPLAIFAFMRSAEATGEGPLAALARAFGAALVLIGGTRSFEESRLHGWLHLAEPFSGEMIEEILDRIGLFPGDSG